MASTTPNIGLTLPTGTEGWKRSIINGNFTILDTKIGAVGNTPLQTQINTLSSHLNNLIKSTTITQTTDAAGNIELTGINPINNFVIGAISNNGYVVGIGSGGNKYYAKLVGNTNPLAPLANTNVTLYVRYL